LVSHCAAANCAAADVTGGFDAIVDTGKYTSITIGRDGLPLISYYDGLNFDLKVAHCANLSCSGGGTIATALDTAGDVGQYTSITIGADGRGLISYYDVTNGDLKIAHCANADCTVASIAKLDSDGDVGQYSSITIGADGLGLISYYDATNGDLKVAHCSNALCTPYFRRR
jgi:cell shape-determining protein MreC